MKLITVAHRVLSLPATTYAGHRTVKATDFFVERKKKYFAAEHLGYCGGTYQALRGGKIDCIYKAVCGQRFFARYSWHAFLRLKSAMNTAKVRLLLRGMKKFLRFYGY